MSFRDHLLNATDPRAEREASPDPAWMLWLIPAGTILGIIALVLK